ncbi:BnaC04g53140D [Brassica napus]|uniref:BnaC04g53140D protein n=1 Tax=Brassica napus TaxID=3708 RepID=A0A078IRT6_BRANA|nr:BnaC04g53140D [Brassica napus]
MLGFAHSHHHPWSSISPTIHLLGTCKTSHDLNKLHARLITTGLIKNPDLTTRIVLAFASASSRRPFLAEFARCVFHEHHVSSSGEVKDPFLWNAVIKSHSHGVDPIKALFLLCLMLETGVPVDKFSISLALKACSRLGYVKEGMQIHGLLIKSRTWSDLFLQNCLIGLYIKCGFLGFARQLFDEMPEKDLISWNSMIGGYVKHGRIEDAKGLFDLMPRRDVVTWAIMIDGGYVQNRYHMEALEVFNHMEKESHLTPDETSLVIVLSAIAQLGRLSKAIDMHLYIVEKQFPLSGKLGVALIDMYSKCGSIQHAMRVFERIKSKSIDHWNAMIGGLAVHGLGESAFDMLLQIERRSIKPDHITFVGVLNACSHSGLVKEGLLCFELMRRKHKIEPKLQHYGCMVDILARSGSIKLAKNLIEGMPIEPNDVIWRTFLTACSHHKEFETGELVAKHLILQGGYNPSSYVLLSNMYASNGMWKDVRRVRTMMKEKKIEKIPGCSWIELDGRVHEFLCR